jgi:23S rRNA pseudouridine2604 synthase
MLSNYGYCSRKDARVLIEDLRLEINGELAMQGQWVEETDSILLDGKPLTKKPPLYFLYHKPKGVLSTMDQDKENSLYHKLVFEDYVFPVGRLDQDSEGLILLTNDGDLAQKILSPKFHHEKEYFVTVNRELTLEFIDKMSQGVDINIGVTKPCEVKRVSDHQFKIILTQGLNRQIRRMSKALGYQVTKLIRLRILNLHLRELPCGECRPLDDKELEDLKKSLHVNLD